jgi:hypothetical protein
MADVVFRPGPSDSPSSSEVFGCPDDGTRLRKQERDAAVLIGLLPPGSEELKIFLSFELEEQIGVSLGPSMPENHTPK